MLNLLFLAITIVFVVDLSGVVGSISQGIWKRLYPKVTYNGWLIPKPFSCSLCLTWGSGLIYLLCVHQFTFLMVLYVALLAFLTPVISSLLVLIKDTFIKLIDGYYERFIN